MSRFVETIYGRDQYGGREAFRFAVSEEGVEYTDINYETEVIDCFDGGWYKINLTAITTGGHSSNYFRLTLKKTISPIDDLQIGHVKSVGLTGMTVAHSND